MRWPVLCNEVLEMDAGNLPYTHVAVTIHNNLQQSHQMLRCILNLQTNTPNMSIRGIAQIDFMCNSCNHFLAHHQLHNINSLWLTKHRNKSTQTSKTNMNRLPNNFTESILIYSKPRIELHNQAQFWSNDSKLHIKNISNKPKNFTNCLRYEELL